MPARLALLLPLLAAGLAAQKAPSPPLPFKLVDGGVYLRAELRAPGQRLDAHVQIDLSSGVAMQLHSNSAQVLELAEFDTWVEVEVEGHKLGEFSAQVSRLRALERVTAENAQALEEVPAVAILGWPAFSKHRTRFDFDRRRLQILEPLLELPADAAPLITPDDALGEAPELQVGGTWATTLDVTSVPRLTLRDQNGAGIPATLGTTAFDTFVDQVWATDRGHPTGALPTLRLGPVELTNFAALRPRPRLSAGSGQPRIVLGTGLLRSTVLTLDPARSRLELTVAKAPADPKLDREMIAAMTTRDLDALDELLGKHVTHRLAEEASGLLLQGRFQTGEGGAEALESAVLTRVKAAPERRRARTAMDLAERLQEAAPQVWNDVRRPLLDLALKASEKDENAETVHKVRSEIGGIYLEAGDLDEAWKHLLGAAFGLPRDGMVNFRLGRLYEKQGRFERAWSRYLAASVTADAGADGLNALKRLAREREITTPFDVDEMEIALEGRVPAFEPASRFTPAKDGPPPTRRVLVELFTGAQCPPCFAADLAGDGLLAHFEGGHVTLIQHHVPIPAPEPMVSRSSMARARAFGVRGAPTVVVGGLRPVQGVGGRSQPKVESGFRALRDVVTNELKRPSPWKLTIDATGKDRDLSASVKVEGPAASGMKLTVWLTERTVLYPGRNRIAFHRHVNRAELTSGRIALAEDAGTRTWNGSINLDAVGDDLDVYLDGQFGADAFAMRPLDLPLKQMGLIAVLWGPNGAAEQTAYWEYAPKLKEER